MDKSSALEELFGQAANRAGSIENLLDEFFGFLHRRTDFYIEIDPHDVSAMTAQTRFKMGFPKGRAEQIVLRSFKQYPFKPYQQAVSQIPDEQVIPKSPTSEPVSQTPPAKSASKPAAAASRPIDSPSTPPPTKAHLSSTTTPPKSSFQTPSLMTEPKVRYTEKGKQIPIGNGGLGDNYFWTQSFREVTISLNVPDTTRTKDVMCRITARDLVIRVAGEEVLAGSFEDPINVSESLWTMTQDPDVPYKQLIITLEKTKETWWGSALVGHPEIDTNMVDSTKRIGDFDASTQATLAKLLWEQREKQRLQQYDAPDQLYDALYPPEPPAPPSFT
jgi:hypothetical protein